MKKQFARAALAAALLCSSAGAALMATTNAALAEQHVSRAVGEPLNEAIKAAQAKDYATAAAALQKADAVPDKSDFDQFKINEIKGFVAIQQQDYTTATTAYEAMIASPAFADAEDAQKKQLLHNGILLSAQAKHWPQVIADAKMMEQANGMDAKSYAVLAQAYYFTNDYANAKTAAQKSIDLGKAAGQAPDKSALEIIMSAQAKSNDQAGAKQTLEHLAVNYGDPNDWSQLIDNALGSKGIQNLDALYMYRLRFFAHAKSASGDYTDAAAIALHLGYPAEAESVLEKGFGNGLSRSGRAATELSQARSGARADKAALPGIARAAERSKAGEQDVKLAEDYWGYGRYSEAAEAARRGLSKGGVKDPSEGQFILGISLVAEGKYAEAREALAKVDGSAARAAAAHLWDLWAQHKLKTASAPAQQAAPAQQ